MDDSQNDESFGGRPSSADAIDLLDLVRGAEEDARVSASTPDVTSDEERGPPSEQYVEVGDEAVDMPPSLPPMRAVASTPPRARISSVPPQPPRPRMRPAENDLGPAMHPGLAIVLIVGAVLAALYGLLLLPPL